VMSQEVKSVSVLAATNETFASILLPRSEASHLTVCGIDVSLGAVQ